MPQLKLLPKIKASLLNHSTHRRPDIPLALVLAVFHRTCACACTSPGHEDDADRDSWCGDLTVSQFITVTSQVIQVCTHTPSQPSPRSSMRANPNFSVFKYRKCARSLHLPTMMVAITFFRFQIIFTVECAVKLLAEGYDTMRFFKVTNDKLTFWYLRLRTIAT